MIGAALGKRFERLLLFTAPISLAAIVVCLVAIASSRQDERVEARCLLQLANMLHANDGQLSKLWKIAGKDEIRLISYQFELKKTWIDASSLNDCYDVGVSELEKDQYKKQPSILAELLSSRAESLRATPLSVYGISLPKNATLNLYVTKLTVELELLTRVLQVLLLPVLLMWLASLYATRYRESISVARAASLEEVFPHIIKEGLNKSPIKLVDASRRVLDAQDASEPAGGV
ncbi:MAG TPA: hypothetical protein VIZ64_04320 [Dokdonella sp.]